MQDVRQKERPWRVEPSSPQSHANAQKTERANSDESPAQPVQEENLQTAPKESAAGGQNSPEKKRTSSESPESLRKKKRSEIPALLSWNAEEYNHRERGADWYWAIGIVSISLAVGVALFGNYLFAAFIVISAFTFIMFALRRPETMDIAVYPSEIQVGKNRYRYREVESFWIDPETDKLFLTSTRLFMPHIVVPLSEEINLDELRDTLMERIPEVEQEAPFAHKVLEAMGF